MNYFHVGEGMFGLLIAALGWKQKRQSDRIEILVNGRLDAALERITQLEGKMTEHGVEIPPGQPSIAP